MASWRSRMKQEYGIAYCRLKGETGSVDNAAIAERMDKIREISSGFEPDNIYNCNETGMYLKELSTHSYTNQGVSERCQARARNFEPSVDSFLCQWVRIFACPSSNGKGFEAGCHFLSKKTLLLIGSCGVHGNSKRGTSDDNDPLVGETWKHLQIERLTPNATAVTQPLDQGTISVFKRQCLEMVSNKAGTTKYQKDAQDMAEEIKQKLHNKIAKRYGSRDRSSSIEFDAIESFKA
ncbi:hypothetical protein EC957_009327 [Mortierella hygrophila]|uniref:Uncharacterized protein n=1 Tax=Mortierella hygrophila TaxID=979708 RepID=A0A9P6FCB4_9FUNG|nr:hypothetical protein EC957_009327 [Mortierella hygrophila]